MDGAHFSPDTRAFLESLAAKKLIGLGAPVKNKRASGRPRDLDDLPYLTRGG